MSFDRRMFSAFYKFMDEGIHSQHEIMNKLKTTWESGITHEDNTLNMFHAVVEMGKLEDLERELKFDR